MMQMAAMKRPIRKVGSKCCFRFFIAAQLHWISDFRDFSLGFAEEFSKEPIRRTKMIRNQVANSADQAQAILGAWRSGDIKLFREELDRVGDSATELRESEEVERMELLRAIAADLRVPFIQPLESDSGNIYSNLLRHLALSHRPLSDNFFPDGTFPDGIFSATTREQARRPSKTKRTVNPSQNRPVIILQ
jgi:hypothetical protein